jgi:hypothetical protein
LFFHSRYLPVLPADAGSCRGRSLSGVCPERSGRTRPQGVPLTAVMHAVVPFELSQLGDRTRPPGRARSPSGRLGCSLWLQALTHLVLISAAFNLDRALGA